MGRSGTASKVHFQFLLATANCHWVMFAMATGRSTNYESKTDALCFAQLAHLILASHPSSGLLLAPVPAGLYSSLLSLVDRNQNKP